MKKFLIVFTAAFLAAANANAGWEHGWGGHHRPRPSAAEIHHRPVHVVHDYHHDRPDSFFCRTDRDGYRKLCGNKHLSATAL